QGDYLSTGQTIVRVADLDHLWIEMAAYESQLPWLRYGERVTFETDAAPGVLFEGRVSFISPTVDEKTRTVAVRVNYDNSARRLKPGLFVRAVLRPRIDESGRVLAEDLTGKWISPMHPEVIKDAPGSCDVCGMDLVPAEELGYVGEELVEAPLVIPASAALLTGKRAVVYVADPEVEGGYAAREVRLGARAGDDFVVVDGLVEGEEVVTRGAFAVDSAAQILAKPSMMSAPSENAQEAPAHTVPASFLRSTAAVLEAYLDAGTALAADDFDAFRAALPKMKSALEAVDASELAGEDEGRWTRLARALAVPADADVADVERARQTYLRWSDAAIELADEFGQGAADSVQLVHCPMAFDFSGADWLQLGDEVANPYFGAEMLRCGTIERSFERSGDDHAAHEHGDDR
ncbi:MAG: efflux RND transporter periplasmic adaptor subunit, partial [Planctomycetes bacterium]|nr:efflux RND transporter periplasmic adaptor subunit [Planctomycetota bacterium]